MLSSDHLYIIYKVDRCLTLGRTLSCYRKKKLAYILAVKSVIIKLTIKDFVLALQSTNECPFRTE